MATRSKNASKTASTTSTTPSTKSKKGRSSRSASRTVANLSGSTTSRSRGGFDLGKFIAPGAAVLASGALAAAGYAFKEQLGDVMVDVLKTASKQGTKAAYATSKAVDAGRKAVDITRDQAMDTVERLTENVSLDSILRLAGLQRRSTVMSIVGPAVGVACGFIAGSALTYFFGPKLLEQLQDKSLPGGDRLETSSHEETETDEDKEEPITSTASTEATRTNGGLHRGIS